MRCEHCPVRAGLPCPGEQAPRLCRQVAEGYPGRAAQLARMAEGRPGPEVDRVAVLADLCPMGSGPCGCGSGPPRICGHPDRPLEVRRADCLACCSQVGWGA